MIQLFDGKSLRVSAANEFNHYRWIDVLALVAVVAACTALFTFCLTEYNIQLDCRVVGSFRIESVGYKCEEIKQ